MVLSTTTGRALLARPASNKGGEMADKAKTKAPVKPERLPMIRVCGRWQKPGYKADDAEVATWKKRCKERDWDPKTGKPKVDPTAAAQSTKK